MPALLLGSVLLCTAAGLTWTATQSAADAASAQNTELRTAAANTEVLVSEEFERAGATGLLAAQDEIYQQFYREPGSVASKVSADTATRQLIDDRLVYLQTLFPGSVARSGLVDIATGREVAEVVNSLPSPVGILDPNADKHLPFYSRVTSLPAGWAYQSAPYFSRETDEWVIANAATVTTGEQKRAVLYFELTMSALRAKVLEREGNATMRAVTERTGLPVIDSRISQSSKETFGQTDDHTFTSNISDFDTSGLVTLADQRVAYQRMEPSETLQIQNDNNWFITASAPVVATGLAVALTPLLFLLLALGIPLIVYALVSYVRLTRRNRQKAIETAAERDNLNARLDDMSQALDQAAAGNLAVTLPVDFEDDRLAALAQSFDNTLDRLRGLVAQAQGHGVQLAQAAGQLRATAQEQAGSATEQSAVVTQTTATIEELAATAAQIAETAGSVARVAQDTLALTDEGRGAVAESVGAMEQIRSVVGDIASSSAGLGDKITQVGHILSLIDELSEQTNLLALNAAIEAARAGEHGRGFAVVAAEVRKLAERAQQSTSQIQGIVTEIQAHTRMTVTASEEGARAVERGAQKATGAAAALDRIAAVVDEASGAAEEISIATQQQRSASDQVVVAMTQVSEASRQYAAGSKQTAAASSQIATLAAAMQDSIATFDVGSDGLVSPLAEPVEEIESVEAPEGGEPVDSETVEDVEAVDREDVVDADADDATGAPEEPGLGSGV
ncbi:MAG TPA: methyl-accepting chemotaxis protein [Actinomycetes bacterium]|nr:methyl-accepting chemotaxis protein [Actinomycetes bacterium]